MKTRSQIKPTALKNANRKIEFWGEVEFGIPSKDCKNYGICRISKLNNITTNFKKKACNCQHAVAKIIYWDSYVLQMQFDKSSISATAKRKYFAETYFKIEEEYPLIIPTENKHTNPICYTIQKGAYPISKTSSHYTLYL